MQAALAIWRRLGDRVQIASALVLLGRIELARGRRNKVSSAEKSNVMETGLLWREVVTDLHGRDYADVTPLKGIYSGSSTSHLFVEVQIRRLG